MAMTERRPVPRDGVLRLCRGAPLRGAFRCCLCDPLFLGPMNYAVAGAQEAAQHKSSTLPDWTRSVEGRRRP